MVFHFNSDSMLVKQTASLKINEETRTFCGNSAIPYPSTLNSVGSVCFFWVFLFFFCCSPIETNIAGEE